MSRKMFLDNIIETSHKNIFNHSEALQYLKSREVTMEDVKNFKIGFSKFINVSEDNHPDRKRFMDETWKGRKLENKLIFPYNDAFGRVMGLAGRSIESKEFKNFVTDEGKYLGYFFGMTQALPHIYATNKVYVVEGYFDLLALTKVFPNTIATITSGMNEAQYNYLCFFCDNIVTCFDNDEAGELGREKWAGSKNVQAMHLGYKDPAQCLETLKLNKFKDYVLKKSREMILF
jgi:DNA primase